MARYMDTVATSEIKSDLTEVLASTARTLTKTGRGSTHFVKLEKKRGVWQVNLYRR